MAKRGDERRNGAKRPRRDREQMKMFYMAGYHKGLRDGWWRGVVVGGVAGCVVGAFIMWMVG